MRITWITDGQGWGHDNQSLEISKRLPEYEHSFVSRKRGPHICGNRWIMEKNELVLERVKKTNPDIVVAMHWRGIDESMIEKAVCRICSTR